MMDASLPTLYIDPCLESYDCKNYLPDGWGEELANSAPVLGGKVLDLVLAWRTSAYTASMPGMLVKSLQASMSSYAIFVSPDASIIAFTDAIIAALSRRISEFVDDRQLRSRTVTELATIADEFRQAKATASREIPIEPIWRNFLKADAFKLSAWSSQRVTFVTFYNAYEAFLVDCVKQVLDVDALRATDKEFKNALRSSFARDIFDPCWGNTELNNARLVRHALSHAGGRETGDLKKQRHGIMLIDGILQILPADNHKLLQKLRTAVESLVSVAAVHSRFQ